MTDTRYLVHGVFWDGPPPESPAADGGRPVLRLQPLSPGHGFRGVKLDGKPLPWRIPGPAESWTG